MKKVLFPILVAVLALAMLMSVGIVQADMYDDWPMFHHDASNSGYTPFDGPDTNDVAWTYQTGASVYSSPAVLDGMLYVGSLDGKLYALDSETGLQAWNFTAAGPIYSSPAVDSNQVYFLDESGTMYALDAATGAQNWAIALGNGSWDWSSPALHGGNVFIADSTGWMHSLKTSDGTSNWNTYIGAEPNPMIAVANGKVYGATHNFDNSAPTLVALDETTGAVVWTYDYYTYHGGVTGMINCNGAAVADGDSDGDLDVYFGVYNWGGAGPQAICLDEATGIENWAVSIGGDSTSTPAVHGGVVFIGSDDNDVYALHAGTGVVKWTYTTGGQVWSSPAVADGKVYVGSLDHILYALDEETGAEVWKYDTGASRLWPSPAVADGMVFIGSENGKVYAFQHDLRISKELVYAWPDPDLGGDDWILDLDEKWYFTLNITVTNKDTDDAFTDVVVTDNFGGDLELVSTQVDGGTTYDWSGYPLTKKKKDNSFTQGEVTVEWSGKSKKVHLFWNVDDGTLSPGETHTLTVVVATDENPKGQQEYTSDGRHCLNSGATIKGIIHDEQLSATTDPICINTGDDFTPHVLIYYGHGGADAGDGVTFNQLKAHYDAAGYSTDYTNVFPADLSPYKLIILVAPGAHDDTGTNYFTAAQVSAFQSFMLSPLKGRLVVMGDHSGVFGINTVNNLLGALGVGITQNADAATGDSDTCPPITDITADQITTGVSGLDLSATSSLTLAGMATSLVRLQAGWTCGSGTGGETVIAVDQIAGAPSRPGSDVVVIGDTQGIDDYALSDPQGDGIANNLVFADNVVGF